MRRAKLAARVDGHLLSKAQRAGKGSRRLKRNLPEPDLMKNSVSVAQRLTSISSEDGPARSRTASVREGKDR
jgi:hypothetical protein